MKQEIEACVKVMSEGGTLLYPTDTIWGIGCDACNPEAVAKVYGIKQRQDSKSMLVLVDSVRMIEKYVEQIPDIAYDILEQTQDTGPLTIIYPGGRGLAENLLAEDGSVGIRITRESFSNKLVSHFGKPIVSTSANIAGQPAPAGYETISADIRSAVDHIAGWGRSKDKKRKPSGILKVYLNGGIEVIRRG